MFITASNITTTVTGFNALFCEGVEESLVNFAKGDGEDVQVLREAFCEFSNQFTSKEWTLSEGRDLSFVEGKHTSFYRVMEDLEQAIQNAYEHAINPFNVYAFVCVKEGFVGDAEAVQFDILVRVNENIVASASGQLIAAN